MALGHVIFATKLESKDAEDSSDEIDGRELTKNFLMSDAMIVIKRSKSNLQFKANTQVSNTTCCQYRLTVQ